jgi:hypothetical protein
MTACLIVQTMPVEGVPREIAIVVREQEENATTPMMIAACVTGSVLILKTIFMPQAMAMGEEKGKNLRKGAAKVPTQEGGIQGQCRRQKLRQWHLHVIVEILLE